MGTVIDHLMSGHRITVIQSFTDANGADHRAGEVGVIRQMGLEWQAQEIWIQWERENVMEKMTFRLDAREGPRSGAMREFFELGEYVPQPRPSGSSSTRPRDPMPAPAEGVIADPSRYDDAVVRVAALAAHRRFDEAETQILQITGWPCEFGWRVKDMAHQLTGMAAAHLEDVDPTIYLWLKGWAIHAWYMWGSGATSGGEGAAFAVEIRAGEKVLAEFDDRRKRSGLRMEAYSA